MSFIVAVGTNLVANVAFWVLPGVLFLAGGRTIERRMVRFFGLDRGRVIQVYLSNLSEPRPDGRPRFTLGFSEFQAVQSVNKLFGAAPLRLPELVRGLVDGIWLRRPVRCLVEVSPPSATATQLSESSVVVGSSTRNSIRRHSVDQQLVRAAMTREIGGPEPWYTAGEEMTVSVRLDGGNVQNVTACKNLLVIEKVRGSDQRTANFYCLGARGDSSWAAVEYLARTWKRLDAEFGNSDVVIVLGIPWDANYLTSYQEPARIAGIAFSGLT